MNKLVPVLIGIAIIISVSVFVLSGNISEPQSKSIYETGFTFYDVEKIKKSLSTQKIFMSSPTEITDYTISQYCPPLLELQNPINHCATTAITDINGNSLGNINMGGTLDGPIMALAILDTSDIFSEENVVDLVFQTMIETLVCDCWDDLQPGGFESIDAWLTTAAEKYTASSQTTLKSKIEGIENVNLILEITSKDESYLWTLIVLK
ncbi:MAG TPA: hypothetical protein OQH54_07515 [Nitrosopumilus sp.]|nr:hypothetical protein [Thermoproteota archaeon]HJJ23541.1 hypothetical protein [Nitrosopumilus sp.]